jgi:ribonuclease HI
MEIYDQSSLVARKKDIGDRASVTPLYPVGSADGLVAVDLLEIAPDGSTRRHSHSEEHVLFVVSGSGELSSGEGGSVVRLGAGSAAHIGPHEPHMLRTTGSEPLRVVGATPLVVRSDRVLGTIAEETASAKLQPSEDRARPAEPVAARTKLAPQDARGDTEGEPVKVDVHSNDKDAESLPDISRLMKRGSDIASAPRVGRRMVAEPPAEVTASPEEDEAEQDAPKELMELNVVFDGGSRGNPGEGYGSYLVQSPGRKPVIKRVEFGDNYTNNQAEYDSLIAALQYIIERLTATGRTPQQVALDIKTDSDLVANQLQGSYKVKDAGLKHRYAQANELLEQFGAWLITWQPREETVRLLGH